MKIEIGLIKNKYYGKCFKNFVYSIKKIEDKNTNFLFINYLLNLNYFILNIYPYTLFAFLKFFHLTKKSDFLIYYFYFKE